MCAYAQGGFGLCAGARRLGQSDLACGGCAGLRVWRGLKFGGFVE